jgi:hypothetical protein
VPNIRELMYRISQDNVESGYLPGIKEIKP